MNSFKKKFELTGQVALVTGAATGIGATIARAFCEFGARVIITDRNREQGEALALDLTSIGYQADFFALDVTSEADWQRVMEYVEAQYGQLDILVNNAGILLTKTLAETKLDEFQMMHKVNVDGVFLGCKFATQLIKKTATAEKRGSIINISSVGGLQGMGLLSTYCSTKGAVRLLTKSLAAELGVMNIKVNSVHPSVVNTAMGQQVVDLVATSQNVDQATANQALAAMNPLQATAEPEDIASAVVFLAGQGSNFMTGAELVVDGGTSSCQ